MPGRCGQRQPGHLAAQGRPHRQPQRLLRPLGNGGHQLPVRAPVRLGSGWLGDVGGWVPVGWAAAECAGSSA